MNRFFCNLQPDYSANFVHHHKKRPHAKISGTPHTKEELQAQIAEAMKDNPDPYEVNREKPGYTHLTGATLILGDESSKGLSKLTRLSQFGAGRCSTSGKKEVAEAGQTTVGFLEKIKKSVGFTMKIYANAIIQIGKHDILGSNDSAQQIYERMQKIWAMFDKHKMKIHVSTIPPIEGATPEQEKRRRELNDLIRETDEPIFNVIDLEAAIEKVDTTAEDLYIDGKLRRRTPKTYEEKMAVVYLEALIEGGRDNFKKSMDATFRGPPRAPYVMVGDSFAKPIESNMGGRQKSPGHFVSSIDPEKPPDPRTLPPPGKNTELMAEKMEKEIIPQLKKKPSYRCAVIQAGAEDVLSPLPSDFDMLDAEEAIIKNLKRMYKSCLESDPPIMVVAVTLPPMAEQIDAMYPGEENREERERHHKLWKMVNDFIIKETFRLSQHPLDWYKRIMCVRAHDMIGTRMGYTREKYKGDRWLNEKGKRQIAMQISKAINQMRIGIGYGANFIPGFHPDKFEMPHHKKYRKKAPPEAKEAAETLRFLTKDQQKTLRQCGAFSLDTQETTEGKATVLEFATPLEIKRNKRWVREFRGPHMIKLVHSKVKKVSVKYSTKKHRAPFYRTLHEAVIIVDNKDGTREEFRVAASK
jgi:hypothetical protein